MTLSEFGVILIGVLLNAMAQLMLKAGTNAIGTPAQGLMATAWQWGTQPFILGGITLYVISLGVWLVALSKVPVSVAYPMLSIGYVVNAFAAWALFGEVLNANKLIGIGIIIVGVYTVARA